MLKEKGYDPLVYRFFCLQSHYRKPLTFSYEQLDNAKTAYEKLVRRVAKLVPGGDVDAVKVKEYKDKFIDKVGMDLNTSLGMTILYDVLKDDISDSTKLAVIGEFEKVLSLGLIEAAAKMNEASDAPQATSDADKWILDLIAERAAAKKNKDYARADAIRAELAAKGITLIDTKDGTTFNRG